MFEIITFRLAEGTDEATFRTVEFMSLIDRDSLVVDRYAGVD